MKCRTVTCAPTNIAVLTVTKRLVSLVRDSNEEGTCRLGDILLFGNYKRMKIKDHGDMQDVFLDVRVKILAKCFYPRTGWKHSLESMICLLEEPKEMYSAYSKKNMIQGEAEGEGVQTNQSFNKNRKSKKSWMRKDIEQTIKTNNKGKKQQDKNSKGATKGNFEKLLTLEEFFNKKIYDIVGNLKFCIPKLLTHLPTSLVPLEVAKNMIAAHSLLESLTTLFRRAAEDSTGLKKVIDEIGDAGKSVGRFRKFHVTRIKLIGKLRCLRQTIQAPNTTDPDQLKKFCLQNATLLFCTASSSAKISAAEKPIELLIIDEAAQLKECESAIPLQIPGIRHAILIGDELQLPAMVISKVWNPTCFCCFMLINYDMFFTV